MPGKPVLSQVRLREFAHELRAPLGGIEAMVEMLAASGLTPEQARIVGALNASLAHLRDIAGLILGGSEPKARREPGEGDFLADFELASQARAKTKGLAFRLHRSEPSLGAACEGRALRQVLENLIDNAVRLTSTGSIVLDVTRIGQDRLRFSLTDTGPGLSEADAARLTRDGGAIEGRAAGAGLGLNIAGRLVSEHGGMLTGGPAPGGTGACFSFDWPASARGKGRLCLLVDDHPASRAVLATILGAAGYRCIEAGSVEQALARIEADSPAIVLTDLNMPGGGGAALIRQMAERANEVRPRIVVVSADPVEAGDPLRAMIDHAVLKPITVRAVLAAVTEVSAAHHRAA